MEITDINDDQLDIIDKNADKLDTSLLDFIIDTVVDLNHCGGGPYRCKSYAALAIVLNDVFEGDWNKLADRLKSEGLFTWSYLDDYNKNGNWRLEYLNSFMCDLSMTIDRNPGFVNKYLGNAASMHVDPDFRIHEWDLFESEEVYHHCDLSKPVVHESVDLDTIKNYTGDLYTAVRVTKDKFPQSLDELERESRHCCFYKHSKTLIYYSTSGVRRGKPGGLIYVPLKQVAKFKLKGDSSYWITALPKEILEKYNLPIVENIKFEDIA